MKAIHIAFADINKASLNKGQIGIGTLIIFIAMVLVAAVAAAILIQTSGVLQLDAISTGKEASKEVVSNLQIDQIEGFRAKNTDTDLSATVDVLKLTLRLSAASEPVDLNQAVITISDGYITNDLLYITHAEAELGVSYGDTSKDNRKIQFLTSGCPNGFFTVDKVRDDDNSFTQKNPVMTSGDVIVIYLQTLSNESYSKEYKYLIDVDRLTDYRFIESGLDLSPRATVNMMISPEAGVSTPAEFTLPTTFGSNERVALYP